jgi:hypothetical protein
MVGRFRNMVKLSTPAMAAMAWRNRDELLDWAGFGLRAAQAAVPGGESFDDVKAEMRLRVALARDPRTRRAPGLKVDVRDGIATLRGIVAPDVYDVAPVIADRVDGVRLVDNRLREAGRWRRRVRQPALSRGR